MIVRALLAFLVLPGTFAYLLPLLLAPAPPESRSWHWIGIPLVVLGSLLLVRCARDFYVTGRGTLAPWAPPLNLVTTGPYARSRNPMYLAVGLVLLGWVLWYASAVLALYAYALMIGLHLRIILFEEPRLASSFGKEWREYRDHVRRWL